MTSQRLIKILIHPFFIGLIVTVVIGILAMPDVTKYKVNVVEKHYITEGRNIYYSDLDADQNSEEINIDHNPLMLKIMIRKGKGIFEQFNLESKSLADDYLYVGDYDLDGNKEIYIVTSRGDSLLLSILDAFHKQDFILKERLIYYNDTVRFGEELPMVFFLGLMNSAEGKNIVFATAAGFCKQPRRIFKYNINKDELNISPLMGVTCKYPFTADINGDNVPEILFSTTAVGNYDSYIPYTDQSAWLMVLNMDLEFQFEPIEFPKYPSNLNVDLIRWGDSVNIVALHEYIGSDTVQSGLYLFNAQGKQLHFTPIEQIQRTGYYLTTSILKGKPVILVLDGSRGRVRTFDDKLEEIDRRNTPLLFLPSIQIKMDIDLDGYDEYIFRGERAGLFIIFREHFRHPLIVDLKEGEYPIRFSTYMEDGIQYLSAVFKETVYILNYRQNPFYYIKFPLMVLVYLAISYSIHLIFRLQKYRAEREYQAKRKMNELQILTLKNQIEPHFTFNILNSIGSLYTRGTDPKLAYNVFAKYSNLLRTTIKNSDRISIPIEEELDFVNTYVELEQFRSGQAFEYQLDIEDGVDLSIHIPRMLIHTFVENAIKHGIRMVEKGGLLELKISRNENCQKIMIRDNGPGLGSKTHKQLPSTGKGLQIVDEMVYLFYQLAGVRIGYHLTNNSEEDQDQKGTEVLIAIPE
jgi:hypothetical protein